MNEVSYNYKDSKGMFSISHEVKAGHYSMTRNHFHEGFEVYYLISGERYYFINDRTYHVKKGDIVFINAYNLHRTTDAGIPNHERLLLQFNKEFLTQLDVNLDKVLYCLFNNSMVLRQSEQDQKITETCLFNIINEFSDKKLGYEGYIKTLLIQFLINSSRNVERNYSEPFDHPSEMHKKVSEIVQYINNNYAQPLTLLSLSEHFFISQYYLTRIFKKATGFTFIEYLNSVRIKHAQKHLLESKLKIDRIAEICGFGSTSQFGRIFKKITGVSPLHYKKNNS